MTTPQPGQASGTGQPGNSVPGALPNGTKVTVSSLPKPPYVIDASRLGDRGTIQYLIAGTWYPKWNVRVMAETVPANSGSRERPSRDVDHKILVDADVPSADWAAMKTPSGLNGIRDAQRKAVFGTDPAAQPKVGGLSYRTDPGFSKFARIVVDGFTEAEGLRIKIVILSNPRHMAVPHDLVPITLERSDTDTLDTIAVLTPKQEDGNICEFEAFYTYRQLAQLLKFAVPQDASPGAILQVLQQRCPELGVKAQWFTSKASQANSANHTSGGVLEKDLSGKIKLRAITVDDLKATEGVRNTEWNAAERLRVGRNVYDKYAAILKPGGQMATSLEAESEYVLSDGQFESVLMKMKGLFGDSAQWGKYKIVQMKDEGTKQYTDTYYDVKDALTMLRSKLVLRRRSVSTDEAGTYLFAVKGRSFSLSSRPRERVRLAAQVFLASDPTDLPPGSLETFMSDAMVDNAFARVLLDGLGGYTKLLPGEWLVPVLTLNSTRTKYSMELANSTTIEFSADVATATISSRTATIHSMEFGVGHPGLVVKETAAATVDPPSSSSATASEVPLVTRPYHVPQDLANEALFAKPDYVQFLDLRDAMVTGLFGMDPKTLPLGGNKAHALATELQMLPQ